MQPQPLTQEIIDASIDSLKGAVSTASKADMEMVKRHLDCLTAVIKGR